MRLTFAIAAAMGVALPALVPVNAPALAAVNTSDPSQFVDTLSRDGFATLRTGDKVGARAKFRSMLAQYFAVRSEERV